MATDSRVLETKVIVEDSDFKKKMDGMSSDMKKFSAGISQGFKDLSKNAQKSTSRIKNMALALFGVYSTYNLLARASRAYLAQDEETSNKVRAAWIGLGAMFAPLLEKIADFAIRAVAYLNVFIKALFGIDLLARAQEKSFGKAAKGVKKFKGALSGLDELTNIEIQTGGAGDIDLGWADEFKNLDLNPNIVKFFENLAGWIKGIDFKQLTKELLVVVGLVGALWGVLQVAKLVKSLKLIGDAFIFLSGGATGLMGVVTVFTKLSGVLITIAGLVRLVEGIINFIKDPSWANFFQILQGIAIVVGGIALVMGGWTVALGAGAVAIGALIGEMITQDSAGRKLSATIKEIIKNEERLQQLNDELADATDRYTSAVDRANDAKDRLLNIEKQHKVSGEEIYNMIQTQGVEAYDTLTKAEQDAYKAYLDLISAEKDKKVALEETNKIQQEQIKIEEINKEKKKQMLQLATDSTKAIKLEKDEYKIYKDAVVDAYKKGEMSAEQARDAIEKAMGRMSKSSQKTFREDLPKDIESGLNPDKYKSWGKKLTDWFSGLWSKIFGKKTVEIKAKASGTGGGGSSFAKGIQEVPYDMIATIHKGEAIVPAKFNKDSYFQGSNQTVVDNREVVRAINILTRTLEDKNMSVNIDKKTIGESAIDYVNAQNRILGRGVI